MRRPPFDSLALALGLYAGAVALVATAEATGVGFLAWTPFVAATVALLVSFAVATTRKSLVTRVVENHIHSVLAFAPMVLALLVFVAKSLSVISDAVTVKWLLSVLLVLLAGVVVYATTMRRYIAHRREHERVLAEWTAGPDARYKWGIRVLSLVGGVVSIVGGFMLAIDFQLSTIATSIFGSSGGALLTHSYTVGRTRQYLLLESELAVGRSGRAYAAFIPHGRFRSVARSERALTIYRGLPWPVPLRCSTACLDDPDAVEATLRERFG